MSMTWQEAKTYVQEHGGDWRDVWKYGDVVRGVGVCANTPCFEWGPSATPDQKDMLESLTDNTSKWASQVEAILDDPPTETEKALLKKMKKWKGK